MDVEAESSSSSKRKFESLEWCARLGDVEDLRQMLAASDPDDLEVLQHSLRAAISKDDMAKVSVLLDAGAKPDSSAMIRAAESAQAGILAQLLSAGGDPNAREWHLSPLVFAVEQKNTAKVSMLLDAGATPSSSAMVKASTHADPSILCQLLAAGGDPNGGEGGERPLHIAVLRGYTATLNCLLEAGADPNLEGDGTFALHLACLMEHTEAVGQLLAAGADPNAKCVADHSSKRWPSPAYKAGDAPIDLIRSDSSVDVLDALLKAGVDPNHTSGASGRSVLQRAAAGGGDAFISKLLEAGANPNQISRNGYTPLHEAAWNGRSHVVAALLAAGADPNLAAAEDGTTALHRASYVGDAGSVAKLLDAGVHPDVVDNDGKTSLHYAAWGGYVDVVTALLAAGADPNHMSHEGRTPLHEVCLYDAKKVDPMNLSDTARMLLKAGADPNARDAIKGWTPMFEAAAVVDDDYGDANAVAMSFSLLKVFIEGGADVLLKDHDGKTAAAHAEDPEIRTFMLSTQAHKRQQLLEARLPTVNEWAPPKRQGNDGPCMVIGDKVWNPKEEAQAQSPAAIQQAPRQRMRL